MYLIFPSLRKEPKIRPAQKLLSRPKNIHGLLDMTSECFHSRLDWNFRVCTMSIVQVNMVCLKTLERCSQFLCNKLRISAERCPIGREAKLRG